MVQVYSSSKTRTRNPSVATFSARTKKCCDFFCAVLKSVVTLFSAHRKMARHFFVLRKKMVQHFSVHQKVARHFVRTPKSGSTIFLLTVKWCDTIRAYCSKKGVKWKCCDTWHNTFSKSDNFRSGISPLAARTMALRTPVYLCVYCTVCNVSARLSTICSKAA